MGAAGCQTRVDADGGEEVGVGSSQDGGHGPAGGQAGDVEAVGVEVVFGRDLARDAREDGWFAAVAVLVGGGEPVPAAGGVGSGILFRIDDEEARRFGEVVHAGASGEVVGILGAAVEHDHQRRGLSGLVVRCWECRAGRSVRRGDCRRSPRSRCRARIWVRAGLAAGRGW